MHMSLVTNDALTPYAATRRLSSIVHNPREGGVSSISYSHIKSPVGATEGDDYLPSFAPDGALFIVNILPHPHGMGLQLLRP